MNSVAYLLIAIVGFALPLRADLESEFRNPPVCVRPYVWWHWLGPCFSEEGITKDLEAMREAGIGGATVFNITSGVQESAAVIPGWPQDENTYRGAAYWKALAHAAREADRLGLELGLHNTVGYSTTGGPWITPERGMQRLVWSEVRPESGEPIRLPPPKLSAYRGWGGASRDPVPLYRDIAVLAVPSEGLLEPSAVLDLTSRLRADDSLDWSPPPGVWSVYRFGYAPTGSTPHPVPDDVIGSALEADKMSADQTRHHWEQVLGPLREKLGAAIGRSFRHVLIDSYEAGPQSWTPGFREEFLRRKGYDPVPWLVSLCEPMTHDKANSARRVIGDEERMARFEFDYREVVADLYRENGWEPAAQMIRESGLALQFEPYTGPFDTIAGAAIADLPMGEFWSQSKGGISPAVVAGARAAGKRLIGAESFTGLPQNSRWDETPGKLRIAADGAFLSGVNRLVLHHWVHQALDDRWRPGLGMGWWGVHFGRNQTWFEPGKAFFAYLGRTQALLQRGEQTIDLLSVCRVVSGADAVPNHVFLRDLKLEAGQFVTPGNRRYSVLVVPHDGALTPETVRRIGELVRAGGAVICARPKCSPSLQNYPACDTEVARLAAEIWGEGNEAVRTLGAGRLFANGDLWPALRALGLDQPLSIVRGTNAAAVRVLERRDDAAQFFFVANPTDNAARVSVSFRVAGFQPEVWDADDGTIQPAPNWRIQNGRTEVDLDFPGADSVFVVFRIPTSVTGACAPEPVEIASAEIQGPWKLEFPGSRRIELPRLVSWTELEDPVVRYFSGTAKYRVVFHIDAGWLTSEVADSDARRMGLRRLPDGKANSKGEQVVRLDLGQVADLATVRLNGKPLGVLWRAPFHVDLGNAVRLGENLLEIDVTNTWHNRLVGDEQEPSDLEWGTARTFQKIQVGRPLVHFPSWLFDKSARPSGGRSTFVTWNYFTKEEPLLPAGLLGPVRLSCFAEPSPSPNSNTKSL